MKLPVERSKQLLEHHHRQFDIITGTYKQDHQKKIQEEIDKETQNIYHKYAKTHNFDPVYGKFYDPSKEENYQKERAVKEKEHGKDAEEKLPPSYVYRQPLIIDYSKPVPDTLKMLD